MKEDLRQQLRPLLWLGLAYALLQLAWLYLGLKFETYPLYAFLHFLDPELLRTRLLESCWYLHIQPPLFNLFCGVVLKIAGASSAAAFHVIFVVLGFLACVSLYALLRRFGVRTWIAFAVSMLFAASPSFVLFEHWLFYTLPCMMLMTASAVFLHDSLETRGRWPLAAFFTCLLLLAGLWSTFHFLHYVLLFAAVLAICRENRRRVLVIGMIPLLIILGWNFKNYCTFGFFGTSSLLGKNLFINTAGNLNGSERERLVAQGVLSPLSLISRWNAVDVYPPEYRHVDGFDDIPALRQESKSHGPHNFNHIAHVAISRQYMKDSLAAMRYSPKSFMLAMGVAWYHYFRPASDYTCSEENSKKLKPLKLVEDTICGKLSPGYEFTFLSPNLDVSPSLCLLFGIPLLFCGMMLAAWRGHIGKLPFTTAQRWTLAYMAFSIVYIAVLGTALDFAETYRYRFTTDPFLLTMLATLVGRKAD